MRGSKRTAWAVAALAVAAAAPGCQNTPQRRLASTEPGLAAPVEPGSSVASAAEPGAVRGSGTAVASAAPAWVERHPLFSRPREYYETTPSNKVVKAAAATVIGIPAGIFGELRQIVIGSPAQPRY